MDKVSTCLWYGKDAEEAAALYTALLPDSRIDRIERSPSDNPGGKAGEVLVVEFTLAGTSCMGLNGGEAMPYNEAMSLHVLCKDQAEIDRLWDGLIADGGEAIECGWLKDRWGVRWQIVPEALRDLIADPDRARAGRAMDAMLTMRKIDIAAIRAAADAG